MNKAISFVGIMGSGKTSIAKKISKKLKIPWIDTDLKIKELTNLSVSELIKNEQIDLLNDTELKIIKEFTKKGYIISTGDNTINNLKAWRYIIKNTISIWINLPLKHVEQRLRPNENRPLYKDEFTLKDLQEIYIKRKKIYQQATLELRNLKKECLIKLIESLKTQQIKLIKSY